jgi:uncharacterized protein (DUF2141 family)
VRFNKIAVLLLVPILKVNSNMHVIQLPQIIIKITIVILVTIVITATTSFTAQQNAQLFINLTKAKKTGTIYVSICSNKTQWPNNGATKLTFAANANQQNLLTINNLPLGTYAIAIYQDVNGNGKLDTNLFGAPKEPYAFSNNIAPVFKAPSFEKCSFNITQTKQQIAITLLH